MPPVGLVDEHAVVVSGREEMSAEPSVAAQPPPVRGGAGAFAGRGAAPGGGPVQGGLRATGPSVEALDAGLRGGTPRLGLGLDWSDLDTDETVDEIIRRADEALVTSTRVREG